MLNDKDFKHYPMQSNETKMFILKMELEVLLENHLLELKESIKKLDNTELEEQIDNAIKENQGIISLLEHDRKKNERK